METWIRYIGRMDSVRMGADGQSNASAPAVRRGQPIKIIPRAATRLVGESGGNVWERCEAPTLRKAG
jgi:hypothetical protein